MNRIPQHSATFRNGFRDYRRNGPQRFRNGPQHTPIYYVYKPAAF